MTCPAGQTVDHPPRPPTATGAPSSGRPAPPARCGSAARRSPSGRTISIHRREAVLQRAKRLQATPEWQDAYRQIRPRVERKIAHFVRAVWGGRRARTRGRQRVTTDAVTRAAAVNWSRLATLGVAYTDGGWAVAAT